MFFLNDICSMMSLMVFSVGGCNQDKRSSWLTSCFCHLKTLLLKAVCMFRVLSRNLRVMNSHFKDTPEFVDLSGMRKRRVSRQDYKVDLTKTLFTHPMKQFDAWFQYAESQRTLTFEEINSFALSTVGKDGRPSCRMVLVKAYGHEGFRFFTNYNSRKGRELAENPCAAMVAYWAPLDLSIRIEGMVEKLPEIDSDEYWPKRPVKSRASAYASKQSTPILSREMLEERVRQVHEQYTECGLDIPRPKEWGGYVLKPDRMEFWQGHDDRLHDRVRFRKLEPNETVDDVLIHQGEEDWIYERLAP